jgi:hypothetical protein
MAHEMGHALGAYFGRNTEDAITFKILLFTDEKTGRSHMRCNASNRAKLSARGDYFHTIGGPLVSASTLCGATGLRGDTEINWAKVEPEYLLALAVKDRHTSDADIRACLRYAMIPEFTNVVRTCWGVGLMLGATFEMMLKLSELTREVKEKGEIELTNDEIFNLIVHPKIKDRFDQKKAA